MNLLFVQRASYPFNFFRNDDSKKTDEYEKLEQDIKKRLEPKVERLDLSNSFDNEKKDENTHLFTNNNVMKSKLDSIEKNDQFKNSMNSQKKQINISNYYKNEPTVTSSNYQIWA